MDTKEAITLIQITGGARIIAARYLGGKNDRLYHFKDVLGCGLAVGDMAVVQSLDSYALVEVVRTEVSAAECGCPLARLKHVVCKVDLRLLELVEQREREASHELALSEVHERLDKYRSQLGGRFDRVQSALLAGAAPAQPADASADIYDKPEAYEE